MKVDRKKRIERLERQERIRARWTAARTEVARLERQATRRLADYRRRLQELARDVDGDVPAGDVQNDANTKPDYPRTQKGNNGLQS